MRITILTKVLGFGIGLLFLGTTVMPIITAGTIKPIGATTYKLVIITPKEFAEELKPLVCHKKKMGISTRLVTLDDVYKQMFWQGRDNAEKIKYFIKTAIEEWGTQYVLLVGGTVGQLPAWYLPVRYVHMVDGFETSFLSDLYYADIYDAEGNFSSWDSDGDGIYGEWFGENAEDKDIDLYPDVAVGRLPCINKLEVKILVDKIIEYETDTYGKPWFNDMIVVAGDTYPESQNPNWTGYEGEYYGDRALENMTGFTPTRLYTSDGSLSDQADVITAVSKGCGFLYFVGHGNPQTWGNHPPNGTAFINGLTTPNMYKLSNGDKLPICVVSGCHNSQFNVTLLNFFKGIKEEGLKFFQWTFYRKEWVPECWSWRMTRKLGGGSIATIGCTALGYTKEDKKSFKGGINELEVEFFKQYGQNGSNVLGDTWAAAITWYLDTYPINWSTPAGSDSWIDAKVVQSWALFGDPSLQIGGYP